LLAVYKAGKVTRQVVETRNSSGDEIVNVNFLYDDIVRRLVVRGAKPLKLKPFYPFGRPTDATY